MSLELSYLQLKTSNEARITVGKGEMGVFTDHASFLHLLVTVGRGTE